MSCFLIFTIGFLFYDTSSDSYLFSKNAYFQKNHDRLIVEMDELIRARDVLICLTLDDQKFNTRNSSGKRIVATISE